MPSPADNPNMRVLVLPQERAEALRQVLESHHWIFSELPYAKFKAVYEKTSVVLYNSGKLVIQGKGTSDFVEFILEPEVLGECVFTGQAFEKKEAVPFVPHAGMDESGKGDYFGPLAASAVYIDSRQTEAALAAAGVCDCKLIKNDEALMAIARKASQILDGRFSVVLIGPEAYNRMYPSFRSLNHLLAWAHAEALESLLKKVPECKHALADKFADDSLILNALKERGRQVRLEQRTRAESDMAVAAASIFARAAFLRKLNQLSQEAGVTLPKGGGEQTDAPASKLGVLGGRDLLGKYAKLHFRNTYKALGQEPPPKKEWVPHKH